LIGLILELKAINALFLSSPNYNKSSDGSSQVSKAEAPVESVALVVASWASGTTGASNMVATHAECGAPGAFQCTAALAG
jgi:hypothetical protein